MILILDVGFLAHRAYRTLGELSHKDMHTGILYGFMGDIVRMTQQFRPDDIVFAFDSRHSVRKEFYTGYKCGRKKDRTPEEDACHAVIGKCITHLRKVVLPGLGFRNIFCLKGYEADDIIAIIAKNTIDGVTIISADHDLWQLLMPNVCIHDPVRRTTMTRTTLWEQKRMRPVQWRKFKIIAGCKSDSVPGVPGFGEVNGMAAANDGFLPPKKAAILKTRAALDIMKRNYELVSLPHPTIALRSLRIKTDELTMESYIQTCKKYGMRSLLRREAKHLWERTMLSSRNLVGNKATIKMRKH